MDDKTSDYAPTAGSAAVQELSSSCETFKSALRRGEPPVFANLVATLPEPQRTQTAEVLIHTLLDHYRALGGTIDSAEIIRGNEEFKSLIEELLNAKGSSTGPRQLGDYELRRLIGRGSMGQVWLAQHKLLNQRVAIKLLRDASADQFRVIERFEREMQTLGKLNDPHIVQVRDARRIDGEYLLVMEYVDGLSLDRLLPSDETGEVPLAVADACEMARQAAVGLQFAHEQGVVHRDIKPSNLILAREGMVKIVDFGLARGTEGDHLENQLTDSRSLLGTLDYMAPEQFYSPDKVSAPADIYSLGCTLHCLLSGKPPFADVGSSAFAKADAHRDPAKMPPWLSSVRGDVDKNLARVVRSMMAKHAEDRYASAADVAIALAPWCEGSDLHQLAESIIPKGTGSSNTSTKRGSKGTRPDSRLERRKFIKVLVGGGALALGVGGASWAILSGKRRRYDLLPLTETIGTLPTLRGGWWFDEIPCLLPSIRKVMVERILAEADGQSLAADRRINELQVDELLASTQSANVRNLEEQLRDHWIPACAREGDPREEAWIGRLDASESSNPAAFGESLQKTLREVELADGQNPRATTLHFKALLNHQLAFISDPESRQDHWSACETFYLDALRAYGRGNDHGASQNSKLAAQILGRMCRSDLTVMYSDRRRWDDAKSTLKSLLSVDSNRNSPAMQLYHGARLGEAQAQLDDFYEADAAFKAAGLHLAAFPANHPLRAFYFESRAWYYVDHGKVDAINQAIDDFNGANDIRRAAAEDDRLQKVFQFHNDHGIGVARHWQGKVAEAKTQLTKVLAELSSELDRLEQEITRKNTRKLNQYHLDLVERRVNSQQRLADCYLFDPDANPDYAGAVDRYSDVQKTADEHQRERPTLLQYSIVSQFRAVIARRLGASLMASPSAQAREAMQTAVRQEAQITDPESRNRFAFAKLCAEALMSPEQNAAEAAVHKYLRDKQSHSTDRSDRTSVSFQYLPRDDRQLADLLCKHLKLDQFNGRK